MSLLHQKYLSRLICFCRHFSPITEEELKKRIETLKKLCHPFRLETKNIRVTRDKSLRVLLDILHRASRIQLQAEDPNIILTCSIKILSQYDDSFWFIDKTCGWKRRKKYRLAKFCYTELLKTFIPLKCKNSVEVVVNAVDREKLWQIEDLSFEIIWQLIESGAKGATVANALCDKLLQQSSKIDNARAIIRTLYEFLDVYKWPQTEDTVLFIERLLKLYHCSLNDRSTANLQYTSFTRGFELCIRYIIKRTSNYHILICIHRMCSWAISENTSKDAILDFGSTLEYAAFVHETDLYDTTLTDEIFPLLLQMIGSSNRLVSLLGNRVLQYLIDRGKNRFLFETPKIFFENAHFHLRSRPYRSEDKAFLKKHRENVHECLLKSVLTHCRYRLNLETTYCTICIIAVEVPCGFTAALLVCLIMNVQEKVMMQSNLERETSYHVHAVIISVMSLLCWIHQAKGFYEYLNKIVMERAQWAPYLNPPIMPRYTFATHHVRWEKPELFFVDWEVRYGLWKRFRAREKLDSENKLQQSNL